MKKKFISSVALAMAAVLTFGMTVSAKESPTTEVKTETVGDLSTVTEEKVGDVTIGSVSTTGGETATDVATEGQTEAAKSASALASKAGVVSADQIDSVKAVAAFDLSGTVTSGSVDVTVKVSGVSAGETYVCMHEFSDGSGWEMLKVVAADNEVTIKGINGFSNFVLVKVNLKTAAPGESTGSAGSTEGYQAFVYTYALKNLKGELQDNAQILKGIGEYNSLSGSEQIAANQLLKNLAGKTYPELYAAAGGQAANVSTTPTSPKTGASLPLAGVLAVLCMAGAAVCTTKARSTK